MNLNLQAQSTMKVIGHRGAMGYEVENSISSIKKAIELGVEMIEIDVFKCLSGEIMVFHDAHLNRLANKDALIEDLTLNELSELHLTNGELIPSLIQVLELINGKVKLNIELKGHNTAIGVYEILALFIKSKNLNLQDILISSFHWNELTIMRTKDSTIKIGVLTQISPVKAIVFAKEVNAYSIHPRFNSLNKSKVDKIHQEGYLVFAYTVNSDEDIEKMIDLKVDGIFTNYPDKALLIVNRN